jgi:hypothetical protein
MANLKKVPSEQAEKPIQDSEPEPTRNAVDPEYTLNIVQDFDGAVDLFYLNKSDPNFEYRWLRNDDRNLVMRTSSLMLDSKGEVKVAQRGGWQICPRTHLLRTKICTEKELAPDGTLQRGGDVVLAFMPKDLYAKKEAFVKKEADAPMKSVKRLIDKGDNSVGRDVHESLKGIQTAKALGMKD